MPNSQVHSVYALFRAMQCMELHSAVTACKPALNGEYMCLTKREYDITQFSSATKLAGWLSMP